MTQESIGENGKRPHFRYTQAAAELTAALRNIADKAVQGGMPMDAVSAAFTAIAAGLSANLNAVLLQQQAQAIAVATPGEVAAIKRGG